MKPTDKEYPELLAKLAVPPTVNAYAVEIFEAQAKREGVKLGYQLALDHTNHAELLEAAKAILLEPTELIKKYNAQIINENVDAADYQTCAELSSAITKSETSKLPTPPQD